jgi:hypothetical protein
VGGLRSSNGGEEKGIAVIGWKQEGKKPLGKPRCRWVDNIKTDFVQRVWGVVDCIDLAESRYMWRVLGNAVTNIRVL